MTAPEATAPARSHVPIVTDAVRLARVLFSPGAVFEEQKDQPTFWAPWLVMSVLWVVLQQLQKPFQARVREIMFERLNRPAPPASAAGNIISMLGGPITVLLICVISAAVLYAITSLVGGETTFKKLLCVSVFAMPVALIIQAVTVVVLTTRGVNAIAGAEDMFVSLGLDLLLPSSAQPGYFVRFLLAGIGPLQIWSLAITAIGLGVMAKLGKGAAWTAATIYFVVVLLIVSGLGAFGMKMMGAAG